jgi:hypothetical protein
VPIHSRQFTPGEFFMYGIPASIILMLVIGVAVYELWPLVGMPILAEAYPDYLDRVPGRCY